MDLLNSSSSSLFLFSFNYYFSSFADPIGVFLYSASCIDFTFTLPELFFPSSRSLAFSWIDLPDCGFLTPEATDFFGSSALVGASL
jgi:hypothetical protein